MATRVMPAPRVMYEELSGTAHFRLDDPAEREAFSKLRDRADKGEITIKDATWPPQIDHKGTPHVFVLYLEKRLLREEEITRLEKKQMDTLNKAMKQGAVPLSRPEPLPGMTLTEEERDLLKPYRESRDND